MQIEQKKYNTFTICFPSPSDLSSAQYEDQQSDTLSKFVQKCPYFDFSSNNIVKNTFNNLNNNNHLIQKFKKQIIAFSIQYGTRSKKTTSIFLKFLEAVRDIGIQQLKKKQYYTACYYFSMSLGFIDPDDDGYLEKFILTKIDIINKMMFSIFELTKDKKQPKYYDWSLNFLQHFLQTIKQYTFYPTILRNALTMIQLNYFYLGRVYKKKKNITKAIQAFLKSQQIIKEKIINDVYGKNQNFKSFVQNLDIKILYKLSKCYRGQNQNQQIQYEEMALRKASKYNLSFYQYINKKIRMYKSATNFKQLLTKIENKKKIEQMVLKQIQECAQKYIPSIYDIYLDKPHEYNSKSSEN